MESLSDQGYIYLNFSPPCWKWDLDKIVNLEISDNVVTLLIEEMQRLDPEQQLALKVGSCLGSSVERTIVHILSRDLHINLSELFSQVVSKGFMIDLGDAGVRFTHDKIEQAAYEMLPQRERYENHMRFGLAICSHALDNGGDVANEDLFFLAINQINRGGPDMLVNVNQKIMIAALNQKAGKRSLERSDLNTAQKFFEHGEI